MPKLSWQKLRERLKPQHEASRFVPQTLNESKFSARAELDSKQSTSWAAPIINNEEIAQRLNVDEAIRQNLRLIKRKELEDHNRLKLEKQRHASKESIRHLRELIRERYDLDLYVYSKRGVQKANRKVIMEHGKKADATLQEIYFIVNTWEEDLFDPNEWKIAKRIKENILYRQDQHRIWGDIPPWGRQDDRDPVYSLQ